MNHGDPATSLGGSKDTEVGSVFVSNYPPYSAWTADQVEHAVAALDRSADPDAVLGIYLHVPFCRRRCKFCYFKVYTDKNSAEIERYLDAVAREADAHGSRAALNGRRPRFVYIGGGTPSYIGSRHLRGLIERLRGAFPWDDVEEVTFECEPGTLTESKLETIRDVGVTRLSLGIENFDDRVLRENGRAHVSKEIERVVPWIARLGFDQLNVDLISGMIGESWDTWRETVRRTIEIEPDSVTIYQLELPYNTVYSKRMLGGEGLEVADWPTKRDWHRHAIEQFESAGYDVSSAYTMVRRGSGARFVYRDSVWRGCDLVPLGVSSFGHIAGVHFQNAAGWDRYLELVESGALAAERAFRTSSGERLTREMILQLKLGVIRPDYFRTKFGVEIGKRFGPAFDRLQDEGMLRSGQDEIRLTRDGLLCVDRLLPNFYAPDHQGARYT